ncbi:MAG: GNAT family N-acetyltransferase, partial [Deltaproteobacteria bacterium]|nr:GNAT family N-acetyltransferase [Deltaproteobacteria bacterium]
AINLWSATSATYNGTSGQFFVLQDKEQKISGTIGINCANQTEAVLEYFRLDPIMTINGMGKKLLEQALSFARVTGCNKVRISKAIDPELVRFLKDNGGFQDSELDGKPILIFNMN